MLLAVIKLIKLKFFVKRDICFRLSLFPDI